MNVAFITGGAKGIGDAIVKKLLKENYKVATLDKISLPAQENLLSIVGDVKNVATIEDAVTQTTKHFGEINLVVANAGIFLHKDLLQTSEEDWDNVLNVNLKGAAFTARACLPQLIKNKGGHIIFIASDQCFIAKKNCPAYAASKAALGQLAKNLALDYAKENIRVNAICPGPTDTPMLHELIKKWDETPDKVLEKIKNEIPLGRLAKPQEVAELVYFLATSSFITGSLYPIDGGVTIGK